LNASGASVLGWTFGSSGIALDIGGSITYASSSFFGVSNANFECLQVRVHACMRQWHLMWQTVGGSFSLVSRGQVAGITVDSLRGLAVAGDLVVATGFDGGSNGGTISSIGFSGIRVRGVC
jgi:hypothetical protein